MAVCSKESNTGTDNYIIAVGFTDFSWDFVTQEARDQTGALGMVRRAYDNGNTSETRTVAFVHPVGCEKRFLMADHDPMFRMYNPDERDPENDEDEEWFDMEGDCDDDYLRQRDR